MVFLKEFFENVDFEKYQQKTKKHAKLPNMQRVNMDAQLTSGVGGLNFGLNLYPHRYFVCPGNDSCGEKLNFSVTSVFSLHIWTV